VAEAGAAPGYVFNVGHGLVPRTPPDNVAALVDAVHGASVRDARAASRRMPTAFHLERGS
jgi:uroporphyrinogen decarboxylase